MRYTTDAGPKPEGGDWDSFAQRVFFAGGGFSSDSPASLPDMLGQARASLGGSPQLVHYLAVPPVAFGGLTQALGQHGLAHGARVVYDMPFGTSPGSFRELASIPLASLHGADPLPPYVRLIHDVRPSAYTSALSTRVPPASVNRSSWLNAGP